MTDHDPAFLTLLQELLQDEGYEALVPSKPEEPDPFIKAARRAPVILDILFQAVCGTRTHRAAAIPPQPAQPHPETKHFEWCW